MGEPTSQSKCEPSRRYSARRNALIYIGREATPAFWGQQWSGYSADLSRKLAAAQHTYVTRVTKQFLAPSAGPILEGGCGLGIHVAALANNGYQACGIDFAEETVQLVKATRPDLDIRVGDVRNLKFPDQSFAGYWSLGVIEHFWDGFGEIAAEAWRVLIPGGILFLTFPALSPLRKYKIRRSSYPPYDDRLGAPVGFYQFALDPVAVKNEFAQLGFRPQRMRFFSGLKGIKDEVEFLRQPLQRLVVGHATIFKRVIAGFFEIASPLAGHTVLLILQKPGKPN
jgi:SAM-dependent methyltransferase